MAYYETMVKIIRNNSYSQITGLKPEAFDKLRKALSYQSGDYFSGRGPTTRYMIDKRGVFPSGLIHRVLKAVDGKVGLADLRTRPAIGLKPTRLAPAISPYPAQKAACASAYIDNQGCISMPTGTGKSLVIAMIADLRSLKTLVVVPSVEIKNQLRESLKASLTDSSHITVENIDSTRLNSLKGFDVLIIDEAHHSAAKTYQKLNKTAWKDIYYRFCLTATPFRNNTEETLLFEAIAGRVIYSLSYNDAVASGYIVPVEGYFLDIPRQATEAFTYREVYNDLVVNNKVRNDLIAQTMTNLEASGVSSLCLVKEISHGKILSDLTGIPFANGQDEESRKYIKEFNSGKIKGLIGTTGVISEGVDTKPCQYVLIAGIGKAKSSFMQMVGRCVRRYEDKESGKVIIIRDRSHKYLMRHFNEQCKVLEAEYNVKPLKLEL